VRARAGQRAALMDRRGTEPFLELARDFPRSRGEVVSHGSEEPSLVGEDPTRARKEGGGRAEELCGTPKAERGMVFALSSLCGVCFPLPLPAPSFFAPLPPSSLQSLPLPFSLHHLKLLAHTGPVRDEDGLSLASLGGFLEEADFPETVFKVRQAVLGGAESPAPWSHFLPSSRHQVQCQHG
jgi:hypothetical protein